MSARVNILARLRQSPAGTPAPLPDLAAWYGRRPASDSASRIECFRTATLQCIRCGACMNHCPVHARIGGHAYGTTYPGPIGAIISPHLLGVGATYALATASTLCGTCAEVCPVRIPIPELLIRLRNEAQARPAAASTLRGAGEVRSALVSGIFRAWVAVYSHPALYRLVTWAMSRGRALTPSSQGAWTGIRTPLLPAKKRLRDLLAERRN